MSAPRMTPARLEEIRARLEAATPRPWAWFGNTRSRQIYLATQRWGRHFVMQFDRWGMQGGQPRFRNWGDERHGARPAGGVMESLSEMGAPVDHNHDLVDVPHPDAALIANAPTYLDEVLPELDAAAHELDLLAETARRLTDERGELRARVAELENAVGRAHNTFERNASHVERIASYAAKHGPDASVTKALAGVGEDLTVTAVMLANLRVRAAGAAS